jgi:acid phosphatase
MQKENSTMKKLLILTLVSLILASCAQVSSSISPLNSGSIPNTGGKPVAEDTASPTSGLPNFDHIVLILLESRDYSSVIGNLQMPQINALAINNALLSNYYAVTHPNLPNTIALMSGSTQGITSNCTDCFINQPNLANEIEASGRTWKAYLESMPAPCFLGNQGEYVQSHNPLLYFDSIRLDATRCDRSLVPLTNLNSDLANNQLPNFSLIIPNECNSGQTCSDAIVDKWAGDMVAKLQASPALGTNSLIVVAFDQGSAASTQGCCGMTLPAGGKVAVVVISPSALPDITDNTLYSHYSLLKTILMAWNLPLLGQTVDAATQPITSPWVGLSGLPFSPNPPSQASPTPASLAPFTSTSTP